MVVFEVPTGIVADTVGRRASYLLGTVTLTASTLLYVLLWQVEAPFWAWAVASMLLGLGFTFFSGAVEAWLVDALSARASRASSSRCSGADRSSREQRCSPDRRRGVHRRADQPGCAVRAPGRRPRGDVRRRVPADARRRLQPRRRGAARWPRCEDRLRVDRLRLARARGQVADGRGPFHGRRRHLRVLRAAAVLLELYGDPHAYQIAGLAAAIVAGAQIVGGLAAPRIRRVFRRRTSALIAMAGLGDDAR